MIFKKITTFLLAMVLVLGLCACSKDNEEKPADKGSAGNPTEAVTETPTLEVTDKPAEPVTNTPDEITEVPTSAPVPAETVVTDMIGREVTVVPGSYKRVVCIGAGALRMYCYVGDVSFLCGVEDIDNESLAERPKMFDASPRAYVIAYGDVFSTLPSCGVGGPNAQAAEAEKILSCDPDIVISEYEDVEKEDALQEQLGVPVITMKVGPGGVFDPAFGNSMKLLGTVFGKEDKAETLINFIKTEQDDISARVSGIADADKPSVYICGLGNWGTTNHLMTAQNYNVFNIANIKNAVTDLAKDGIQPIEEEKFIALGDSIDVMIIDAAAVKNIKPLYQEKPDMFDECKAWKNGEVYLQMPYNCYYTNFETALINTWFIGKSVYPDAFADIDITAKTNEITNAFLGKELADKMFAKPASIGGYQKIDTGSFFE